MGQQWTVVVPTANQQMTRVDYMPTLNMKPYRLQLSQCASRLALGAYSFVNNVHQLFDQ